MAYYKLLASDIGDDAGPFVIKSQTGAILATGVTRQQLLDGFTLDVPAGVTSVTVSNVASNTTCITSQTFQIPAAGRWEMEKTNVETISDHYGVIFAPYTAPVESFVADDIVGIYAGVASGTGIWTIKAGPEDIAGTTYAGGGTLIATGANTNTQTNVESGATLQLGYSTDSYTGQVGGTLNIAAGATVAVVGANEAPGRTAIVGLVNDGALSFTGPDRCGEGNFRVNGPVNNRSQITVDDAKLAFLSTTTFGTGTGTILVKDGATLEQGGANLPATQTLLLNGCGKCNDVGNQDGALLVSGAGTIASPIVLESDVCMDHVGSGQATISGRISGDHKITLNNQADSTTRQGSWGFTSNTAPFFDNTLEVKGTTLYGTGANALSKADVVFVGNAGMQSDGGTINLGSLSSDSATSFLLLNSSGGIVLKENGETTFAGLLQNSTPGTPWPFTIVGPDTNVIKLTHPTGNSAVNLASSLGGRIIVEDGTYNQWNGVGTISAGESTTSRINTLTIGATSALDVYASGSGTGKLWAANALNLTAGWKVNVMDNLGPGTYNILQKPNTVAATLPVIGTNASGLTATFANVGNMITMTLA